MRQSFTSKLTGRYGHSLDSRSRVPPALLCLSCYLCCLLFYFLLKSLQVLLWSGWCPGATSGVRSSFPLNVKNIYHPVFVARKIWMVTWQSCDICYPAICRTWSIVAIIAFVIGFCRPLPLFLPPLPLSLLALPLSLLALPLFLLPFSLHSLLSFSACSFIFFTFGLQPF